MRSPRKLAFLCALLMTSGCHRTYVPPETPMPANTVLLSQMMRELSAQPGFTDTLVDRIEKGGKKGPALLTPMLIDELRKRILGQDWHGLDRFPGLTMREINPTVRVIGHEAGKSAAAENLSAVHPGASPSAAQIGQLLDVGDYRLDRQETEWIQGPSTLPAFTTTGIVSDLGSGVTRGDGPNQFASEHAESQRLANALNRLSANSLSGVTPMNFMVSTEYGFFTPEDLIDALILYGHTVTVTDTRYFANFAHLHYKGQDVMAPFWVNSQIIIPNSGGRPLLVPVAHAEYEWHIRGPLINADVSYYFGIDGKSEWRTMDTLDQPWVLKRDAHTYTGDQAVEVTRLAGLLTVAYMHLHAAHPTLPFGGYYALGVCQDGVSAIEKHMTGKVTLFPNTADDELFNDPRDAEVNALIAAIPNDRDGKLPDPARIFGSLPTDDFSAITIPGLAADLTSVHTAWTAGTLTRTRSRLRTMLLIGALIGITILGISLTRHHNLKDADHF
ncbi:MAG TPA: hypothetical protein VFC39_14880 [Acidobacteriaceae bacterium]|nr:hypothetical protein [Acidobacteriaceae bacterium]